MLLTIEKLIYGGDGLSRLPADSSIHSPSDDPRSRGKAVFLPFVIEAEVVEGSLTEQKPGFARARADAIVTPSPHRVEPACPYFGQCGGCHYQHINYQHQLRIKEEILRETLHRTAKVDLDREIQVHPSPPWSYRNRSRLQVQPGPPFAAGYYKMGSHELLPVQECPISSPLISSGIAVLWRMGGEAKVPAGVREVEFFANADDSQLLLEISCATNARRASIRAWCEDWLANMAEIAGVVAYRSMDAADSFAREKFLSLGSAFLTYETKLSDYRVSAGSFFQTNRFLTDKLVEIVTSGEAGELALDLYAGVGLFSTALRDFHHIVSVESSQTSSADLSYNQLSNGEAVRATTEQYLARAENSGRIGKGAVLPHHSYRPDLAVVDPPRSGLGERVVRSLEKLGVPRVTYVSCDPATLARDLRPLLAAGYRLEQVHLVDLFPHTYHIESVVRLAK